MTLIYDALGHLKDWNWLWDKYGEVRVHSFGDGAGWRCFALCEDAEYDQHMPNLPKPGWWPKQKPFAVAAIVVKVMAQDGTGMAQIPVARHWPDAPLLPEELRTWQDRAVVGETNGEGLIGFGMGPGDFYYPPAGGVTWVWVCQLDIKSEAVSGLGMLGGTNHWHINPVFRYESEPEPPPPESQLDRIEQLLLHIHSTHCGPDPWGQGER